MDRISAPLNKFDQGDAGFTEECLELEVLPQRLERQTIRLKYFVFLLIINIRQLQISMSPA
jgi:hypothetical protein